MKGKIDSFTGEYFFLNNFYVYPMVVGGKSYRSMVHYYYSMRAAKPGVAEKIRNYVKPSTACRRGRMADPRSDWQARKRQVVFEGLQAKFAKDPMRKRLLATSGVLLINRGDNVDPYWGIRNGGGLNMLGQMLMTIRKQHEDRERTTTNHPSTLIQQPATGITKEMQQVMDAFSNGTGYELLDAVASVITYKVVFNPQLTIGQIEYYKDIIQKAVMAIKIAGGK